MMKRNLKRIATLIMVLCLTMSLFAGSVGAASVSASVKQMLLTDAQLAGYSPEYTDDFHFVDAGRVGADVTATLPHDLGVSGRTVAVAVRAVNADGTALTGHKTRIVLGSYSGGAVTVTYQENGCRYFAMMPVQGYIDQGCIHYLETSASKVKDGIYDIYVEARLIMSDDLAQYVVINKSNPKLLNMRFTCYLENDVLNSSHNADLANLVFDDPHGIYDLLENETYVTKDGLVIKYKLNEEVWESWRYESATSLMDILQTEVVMSCDARVSETELRAGANADDEIWSYGHLDLTYEENGRTGLIPAVELETMLIPAEMDYIVLDRQTGGSGGVPGTGRPGQEVDTPSAPIPDALNGVDHVAYIIGYEDGSVRPNNNITRAEVATIFFRLLEESVRDRHMTQDNDFSDVSEGQWFNCAISTMSSMGIINGYPDGTFRPNEPITRAEFAAIAARFDKRTANTAAKFSDIRGHWAINEISVACENGWINGYPNGTFAPNQDITRAEAMTLVNRVLHRNPEDAADLLPGMAKWTDNMNKNAWYYLAVQEATNSHDYNRKTNYHEYWTDLEANPDWSLLEK